MIKYLNKIVMYAVALATTASAVTVDFSSAEGFNAAALNGQQMWNAGGNWTVNPTTGTIGTSGNGSGAFQRGNYAGFQASNTLGTTTTVTTNFGFNGNYTAVNAPDFSGAAGAFRQGLFTLDLTHQLTNGGPVGNLSAGIFLNATDLTILELRVGSMITPLGAASSFNGQTFSLVVNFSRNASNIDYTVAATLTPSGGSAITATNTAYAPSTAAESANFLAAPSVQGFFNALPASGISGLMNQFPGAYSGVTVSSFAIEAVPEPSSALLLGLGGLALLRRRRA